MAPYRFKLEWAEAGPVCFAVYIKNDDDPYVILTYSQRGLPKTVEKMGLMLRSDIPPDVRIVDFGVHTKEPHIGDRDFFYNYIKQPRIPIIDLDIYTYCSLVDIPSEYWPIIWDGIKPIPKSGDTILVGGCGRVVDYVKSQTIHLVPDRDGIGPDSTNLVLYRLCSYPFIQEFIDERILTWGS